MTNHTDKPFYHSKKWIAWVVMLVVLTGLAVLALLKMDGWPLSSFLVIDVIIAGAVTFGLIDRQASMDRFLRGIALNTANIAKPTTEGDNERGGEDYGEENYNYEE